MAENISVHILLCRLKCGDEKAIEILYPLYAKIFYKYAASQRGLTHEDAEDIVDETFLHILRSIETYDEVDGHGEQWMCRICRNLVIDMYRRKRMISSLVDDILDEDANPEKSFGRKEYFRALKRTFERISEADRRELQRGRGRGPGRKAWHEAARRFRTVFYEEW